MSDGTFADGMATDWMFAGSTATGGIFANGMGGDNWSVYRERRQLRSLTTEVAALDSGISALSSSLIQQRAESNQLRSQVARLQGSLEERVDAMGRSFDAFVELTEIRAVLAMFDAPAMVRHRSRQLLAALSARTDTPKLPELPGADGDLGYWLAPAIRALVALLRDADADADIAAAQRLDPEKTSLLIVATTSLAGRRDIAGRYLPSVLGEFAVGLPVTRLQRLLWQSAARGAFGPAAEALILRGLETAVAAADGTLDNAVRSRVARLGGVGGSVPLFDHEDSVTVALAAGRQLAEMRALSASTGVPSQSGPGDGPAALAEFVRRLVDEGTEEERPLLRRAEELLAIIAHRTETVPDWTAAVGTVDELLIADAFDPASGPAGVLARRVLSGRIATIAAELAATATVGMPDEIKVGFPYGTVRVTTAGADATDVAAIRKAIELRHQPEPVPDGLTWAYGIGGILVGGLGALLSGALFVVAILVGAGLVVAAVIRFLDGHTKRDSDAEALSAELRKTDRRIAAAATDYDTAAARLADLATQASADRDALRVTTVDALG